MKGASLLFFVLLFFTSCIKNDNGAPYPKIRITTTTTIITDLVQNIGGDEVEVVGLMGPGIDPHLYKASENDVIKLSRADMIIYGGLHLEGKLISVFEKLERLGKTQINLGRSIPVEKLHSSESFGGNYDPHVWFDISLFKEEAKEVAKALSEYKPELSEYFNTNLDSYLSKLEHLENEVFEIINTLPKNKRILVTAHDAFGYFGAAYDFEVVGLQGISTTTEAGVKDVRNLTDFIVNNEVKSIFIESSVPIRTIEALQKAVKARGHEVKIGGTLYSDALGTPDTNEGDYIGMFLYNVKTIVGGLK